jgi:hypothetical protein
VTAFDLIATWGVPNAAVAVADRDGVVEVHGSRYSYGDPDHRFGIASVSKLFVAYAALIAVEEGTITLDEPAGPAGSTVRHLLSHAAGYGFTGPETIAPVGRRRIYSNTGIEVFAEHLAQRSGIPFAEYLNDAVFDPLGMTSTELRKSPAHGIHSTVTDLVAFVQELLAPTLVAPATLAGAVAVQFPGLAGIVPGVGRFDPCDWGLGFERNLGKPGHWSGTAFSRESFGHFGGSGTFLVIDPLLGRGVVCLTDREYDDWALEAWPVFCNALVGELR